MISLFRKSLIIFITFFAIFQVLGATFALAANSGFVNTVVDISERRPSEGEEVILSVEFVNMEQEAISGSIAFYNNNELLGSRSINISAGESEPVSISWLVSLGDHRITASAENLRIGTSNVRILTSSTEPLMVSVGFRKSQIAASVGSGGSIQGIVKGLWQEAKDTVVPFIERVDLWRFEKISPWEMTRERLRLDKENQEEGKMQAILTMHILGVSVLIIIFSSQILFFTIASILVLFVLITLIKKMRRLFRRKYSGDE